jgi:GntP family gluconate:H+ symporter
LGLSLLPILVPLVLIAIVGVLSSIISGMHSAAFNKLILILVFLGDKNTALVIGGLIHLYILLKSKIGKGESLDSITKSMEDALMSSGLIILIMSAGGAFGAMLQQTGIGVEISKFMVDYQLLLIPMGFFVAAIVRPAQGSATVSIRTAAGILSGLATHGNLGYNVLYLGLAIACGSKIF